MTAQRRLPPMATMELTDERRAFVESVQDFCRRECGTREQRDRLTNDGAHTHNQEIFERMAQLGWLGVSIDEEYGGAGGGPGDQGLLARGPAYGRAPGGGTGPTGLL